MPSEQIISELLQCLGLVIEEKIILEMQSSDFFALMTDESTDIASCVETASSGWTVPA